MSRRLIRKKEVLQRVGLSYPTIWSMMREGAFPRSIRLTDGPSAKVAWLESDIDQWMAARPQQKLKGDASESEKATPKTARHVLKEGGDG